MPATGDRVPAGGYVCENCGAAYQHKAGEAPLPICQSCGIWTLYQRQEK